MQFKNIFTLLLATAASAAPLALSDAKGEVSLPTLPTVNTTSTTPAVDAITKRNPITIAAAVLTIVNDLTTDITEWIDHGDDAQSEFTKRTVNVLHSDYPGYDVIVFKSGAFDFHGVIDSDTYHMDFGLGWTADFYIYVFESGTFQRHGDGGYINWCYRGCVSGTSNEGANVQFC